MKKLYILFLMLVSFSTSVYSAPSFNSIFDGITDETIEIADNEYDEAMQLSDRANLPTKEMLEKAFSYTNPLLKRGIFLLCIT